MCNITTNFLKLITNKKTQLVQRDRAMRYISWNVVSCCTAVRKIAFEKACHRRRTLKVTQGHRK